MTKRRPVFSRAGGYKRKSETASSEIISAGGDGAREPQHLAKIGRTWNISTSTITILVLSKLQFTLSNDIYESDLADTPDISNRRTMTGPFELWFYDHIPMTFFEMTLWRCNETRLGSVANIISCISWWMVSIWFTVRDCIFRNDPSTVKNAPSTSRLKEHLCLRRVEKFFLTDQRKSISSRKIFPVWMTGSIAGRFASVRSPIILVFSAIA